MLVKKIKSLYSELTASEIKIADYLLANIGNKKNITSTELAEIMDVSQSTIIRFSQKLGYKSFKLLAMDFSEEKEDTQDIEIKFSDSMYEILEKVKANYESSIQIAFDSNESSDFEKAAKELDKSESIICFGYQATGGFAAYLSESLIELGKSAYYSNSLIDIKQRLLFLNAETDYIILISKSGETKETNNIAEFAQNRGIRIISITNIGKNYLSDHSDISINFLYNSQRARLTAYTQNAGLVFIIDSLILSIYRLNYAKYRKASIEFLKLSRPGEYED
ncbi:MurR/RpiR family transcriptional regulator [Anaerococcus lactolyticus]|uniref:MurR/RpiR family transcriptional regulator n=1 Tax=Anaerococcus lactolyticus TaxID=33032 RepID=UPI00288AB604|nr:MurR/RpiR family transcriptional regulator [Anaerococcus lactolyticus]